MPEWLVHLESDALFRLKEEDDDLEDDDDDDEDFDDEDFDDEEEEDE